MKFKLHYTHNFGTYKDVEINTLEELLELVKKEECGVIIDCYNSNYWKDKSEWVLEVYDNYRE